LIGRNKNPRGPNLGIVTNAGGPGVIATDSLIASGGVLAKLSVATLGKLNDNLPPAWSHVNPVDVLGDANSKRIEKVTQIMLEDPGVDAVLIADAWQKKELGSILTDYCLEIAAKWNLKRIVAQTTTDNSRMISVFKKRGFRITIGDDSTVDVVKGIN
jgi:acyl-CoA synthetase (NDP forming)